MFAYAMGFFGTIGLIYTFLCGQTIRVPNTDGDVRNRDFNTRQRQFYFIPPGASVFKATSDKSVEYIPSVKNVDDIPSNKNMKHISSHKKMEYVPSDKNVHVIPSYKNMKYFPSDKNMEYIPSDRNVLTVPSDQDKAVPGKNMTSDKNVLNYVQEDRNITPQTSVESVNNTELIKAVNKSSPCPFNVSTSSSVTKYDFIPSTTELREMFDRGRMVQGASCHRLFDGDRDEIVESSLYMANVPRKGINDSQYVNMAKDCSNFKKVRGYFATPFTETEASFPLAFSIVFFSGVEQLERLLRAVYRPQNYYCIHVDAKTRSEEKNAVSALAACFQNVFVASRAVDVQWGKFSVLEADLICMRDLWAYPKWKYFINLTGQEFPLKTNLELVKILQAMQGANVVDGTWVRARANYFGRWTKSDVSPPHGIRPVKGSVHVAVNRDFVDYALHERTSLDFLAWLNNTEIPDETFFASLNHNPHLKIPGSFLGEAEEYPMKPTFTRYKNWEIGHGVWTRSCAGKFVRNVCVLGIGDLHRLSHDIGLFVNKFHLTYEYLALDCMEELVNNRTRDQYLQRQHVDVTYYAMLDQVKLRYVKPQT